jgi:hypothetical protein
VQLPVDGMELLFCPHQQTLDLGRDLGLQMILQHGPFLGRKQFGTLGDLLGEARGKTIRTLGAIPIDDVDDEAPVARFGRRLVAECAEGALQLRQFFVDLPLHARPRVVVVPEIRQRLLDSARQREGGINRPGARHVRQFDLRQCRPEQAGSGELLQPRNRLSPCFGALLQDRGGAFGSFTGDCAYLGRLAEGLVGKLQSAFPGFDGETGVGQFPLQLLDLGADRFAQRFEPGGDLFGLAARRREPFLASLHVVARLLLAQALTLQLGQRQPQLVDRLDEPGQRIAVVIQRCLDGRERRRRCRQAKVGCVCRESLARAVQGLRGLAAAAIGFRQFLAGSLQFASAGGGSRMGSS